VIIFQPIRVKQSPIEIHSHGHLENVLFYNRQSQSNRQSSVIWPFASNSDAFSCLGSGFSPSTYAQRRFDYRRLALSHR